MMDLENITDTQTEAEELEEVVMGLIINSGQARSLAYAALKQAKQGDFDAAKTMMEQSRMALNEAHLVQTKLIEGDQGEGKMKVSLVLVHAQDHLMTSMLARELEDGRDRIFLLFGAKGSQRVCKRRARKYGVRFVYGFRRRLLRRPLRV